LKNWNPTIMPMIAIVADKRLKAEMKQNFDMYEDLKINALQFIVMNKMETDAESQEVKRPRPGGSRRIKR
jgi:hypothetical protein